jgi:hypothetical protein
MSKKKLLGMTTVENVHKAISVQGLSEIKQRIRIGEMVVECEYIRRPVFTDGGEKGDEGREREEVGEVEEEVKVEEEDDDDDDDDDLEEEEESPQKLLSDKTATEVSFTITYTHGHTEAQPLLVLEINGLKDRPMKDCIGMDEIEEGKEGESDSYFVQLFEEELGAFDNYLGSAGVEFEEREMCVYFLMALEGFEREWEIEKFVLEGIFGGADGGSDAGSESGEEEVEEDDELGDGSPNSQEVFEKVD